MSGGPLFYISKEKSFTSKAVLGSWKLETITLIRRRNLFKKRKDFALNDYFVR